MDNRKLYIAIGILIISVGLGGCNNADDGSAVSVFSNVVQEIEIPEPEPIEEPDNNIPAENEEVEQEINAVEDQTVEDTSNFSGGEVDYSNEPWYVEGIIYSNDNDGQGWDIAGKHFDTWGEYMKYSYETTMSDPDFLTEEELEILGNGGTIMN